jgi:hypothetical protein
MPNDPIPDERFWQELQIAYADAMWVWAEVETSLFTIFVAAVNGLKSDIRPTRAAFFAIHSFEMRLTATHAAREREWHAVFLALSDFGRELWRVELMQPEASPATPANPPKAPRDRKARSTEDRTRKRRDKPPEPSPP